MTAALRFERYSMEDYLRLEAFSNVKHEYLDGEIYAMAGGTPEHGAVTMRVGASLVGQLRGRPCNVHSSDVRVRVVASGLDTYPDVSVVCGKEVRDTDDPQALTNPIVLVEVLSPATARYDRGKKLEHEKRIQALQEVVLVAHDERRIDVWRRTANEWEQVTAGPGETIRLTSIDCLLDLDELFRDPLS